MFLKNKKINIGIFWLLLILVLPQVSAQDFKLTTGDVVDRIVAIVGNDIILKSDIDAVILEQIVQGQKMDINDPVLRKQILDAYIEDKILSVKAEEDSIVVSDDMAEERWNILLQQLTGQYGSVERIESLYKKSISKMKIEAMAMIKKKLMSQQLEQKKFNDISVNSVELKEFYNKYKDSLPVVPEQMAIYHIMKYIQPDTTAKIATINKAKEIRNMILGGGDFAALAKEFSADPGSASEGGDLGWVEKGKFVSEFERAAFALQPGEISLPVETPFGYHIIKLIGKKKDSIHTAHILLKLIQSEEDVNKVKKTLDSLRLLAVNTDAKTRVNFETLAKQNSDDRNTRGFGGFLGKMTLQQMPVSFSEALKDMKDGDVSSSVAYTDDPTKQGMSIIWRKQTIPSHQANIDDDYEIVKQIATHFKVQEMRKDWVANLKKEIYWEVFE